MARTVSEAQLRRTGWTRGSGGAWYWYLPGDQTTHIHLGGSNRGGTVHVKFISLKNQDSYHAHFYNEQRGAYLERGNLETLPDQVATSFRRGLNAIGFV